MQKHVALSLGTVGVGEGTAPGRTVGVGVTVAVGVGLDVRVGVAMGVRVAVGVGDGATVGVAGAQGPRTKMSREPFQSP